MSTLRSWTLSMIIFFLQWLLNVCHLIIRTPLFLIQLSNVHLEATPHQFNTDNIFIHPSVIKIPPAKSCKAYPDITQIVFHRCFQIFLSGIRLVPDGKDQGDCESEKSAFISREGSAEDFFFRTIPCPALPRCTSFSALRIYRFRFAGDSRIQAFLCFLVMNRESRSFTNKRQEIHSVNRSPAVCFCWLLSYFFILTFFLFDHLP